MCVCVWLLLLGVLFDMQYRDIISVENLFQAWNEFKKGKRGKRDVQIFERNLEDNLFSLRETLLRKTYKHGPSQEFYVEDPKRRHIHKAQVKDRVLHHLLYKFLYRLWDKTFIHDSYSCRLEKGTHRGVKRLFSLIRKVSKNYTGSCWALKCDIRIFFAAIDHGILLNILSKKVKDKDIFLLLNEIVGSFNSNLGEGKWIPLGNLTS